MKDLNEVRLRGRVGSVKVFGNGSVASISVATTESYKDRNGKWNDITTWHRVKAFSSRPGLPPFDSIEKGMYVMVTGKLTTNSYTDKDGNEKETTEIDASEIVGITELKAAVESGRQSHQHNYDEDF